MIKIYPVIHHRDSITTRAQAILCAHAGADGIFLISHNGCNEKILELAMELKCSFPGAAIGVNLLGYAAQHAIQRANDAGLDMVWLDHCGIHGNTISKSAQKVADLAAISPLSVFAGVAFKYQDAEPDPVGAARQAQNLGLIPTTSGPATGQAPTVGKILSMSLGVRGKLAIASGMNCNNIEAFAPHLSYVLVSTGVSHNEYEFDFELLYRFIRLARQAWQNENGHSQG